MLSSVGGPGRAGLTTSATPGSGGTLAQLRHGLLAFPHEESNALLIPGRHTASGLPVAVIGPQVGYFNPQILMEEDVHGPGIDARGAAFDGLNFYVQLGRGQDYAWSATSSGQDITHVFAVDLCNPDGSSPDKSGDHYLFRGQCLPMSPVTVTDSWVPNAADMTPPGTHTLTVQRTKLGTVFARATIGGHPVAYTRLRSTYLHEIDSALGFKEFNDPGVVHDAKSFQRAAYKIGYTFNWLYTDNRDIAMLTSGANPAYDPRVDPVLPEAAKYEWQHFNPDINTADYTPFKAHPQVINQDYLTSWNNKSAPAFGTGDTPVYRSQLLDDRVRPLVASGHKATLPELISAMEDAGTVDLRADKELPLALRVLGAPTDPQLSQAVQGLQAWVADGAHRIDRRRGDTYAHSDAIAIFDAWWPLLVSGEFKPVLGDDLYSQIFGTNAGDDTPHSHLGSAYNSGAYGYTDKDLRTILGLPVQGRYHQVYCGSGDLVACRTMLSDTLRQAIAAASNRNQLYSDSACPPGDQACGDKIIFRAVGAVSQPLMAWVNRPTYQQALEIQGHRPRAPESASPTPRCKSHRRTMISVRAPRGSRVRSIALFVGRRRVRAHLSHGRVRISFAGNARGAVHVRIRVRTTRGNFTIRRTYHPCTAGQRHAKRVGKAAQR